MNKKKYIAPQMEVIYIETVQMLAASPSIGMGEGEHDAGDAYSNDRRGTWGNLWSEGEE